MTDTTRIRVLDDQPFSDLLVSLSGESESVARLLEENYNPPVEPGTEFDANIDGAGKAHYFRTDVDQPWYSPKGWYEIIEEDQA